MSEDTDPSGHTRPADEDFVVTSAIEMFQAASPGVVVGLGDDAAVIDTGAGEFSVESCDCAVEGIHFKKQWLANPLFGARAVGARAVLCAASDMAAMGAEPKNVLLSLGFPPDTSRETVRDILSGAREASEAMGADVVGGNTTRAPFIFADVKVTGATRGRAFVRCGGAQPGDDIFVTGTVAEAAAGMAALDRPECAHGAAVSRFRFPAPRIETGLALCALATAMTDVSDGLLFDAERLAPGAVLFLERVPVCEDFPGSAADAVTAGGDYELVFAAPPRIRDRVAAAARGSGVEITRIGEVSGSCGMRVFREGTEVPRSLFSAGGYRHNKKI